MHLAFTTCDGAMQILAQNRDFCITDLPPTPPLGEFPSEYCHAVLVWKYEMAWLPDGAKKFEDTFIRCDRIHEHERERRTDGHTDEHRMTA